MNTDQIASYIRSILKIGGALLMAHGYQKAGGVTSDLLNAPDIIGFIATGIGLLMSHFTHSTPPDNASGSGKTGGAAVLLVCAGAASLFLFTGCASSPSRVAYNAELAAASTSDAAMRSYAVYWEKAYASPATFHRTVDGLVTERQQVENISVKIGSGVALVETLRESYQTNSAVEPQLNAAVAALTQNTAQIVPFITSFFTVTNQ
jgi:hypothetical protein